MTCSPPWLEGRPSRGTRRLPDQAPVGAFARAIVVTTRPRSPHRWRWPASSRPRVAGRLALAEIGESQQAPKGLHEIVGLEPQRARPDAFDPWGQRAQVGDPGVQDVGFQDERRLRPVWLELPG